MLRAGASATRDGVTRGTAAVMLFGFGTSGFSPHRFLDELTSTC